MVNFSRSFHIKALPLAFCIGVLSLCHLTFAQNPSPGQKGIPANSDAQLIFDALKRLAGTWTGPVTTDPPNPDIEGPTQVTMRVASRGNVLAHEIAPGGVPEPAMMYLERDRLTLVHYFEAGNLPRMLARKSPNHSTAKFELVDISGSPSPVYVHDFVFTIVVLLSISVRGLATGASDRVAWFKDPDGNLLSLSGHTVARP